jgi:hypothetical protein
MESESDPVKKVLHESASDDAVLEQLGYTQGTTTILFLHWVYPFYAPSARSAGITFADYVQN